MNNKKSKISAILTLVTVLLLVGLIVMLQFMEYKVIKGQEGAAIGLIFVVAYGYPTLYAGAGLFGLVALIIGLKMLLKKDPKKLSSLNIKMLVASIVIMPVIAGGLALSSVMIFGSTWGVWPILYTAFLALTYVAMIIAQIATIAMLKRQSKELIN